MFRRKFKADIAPAGPLYVIGDVHGRYDLMTKLLAMIKADAEQLGLGSYQTIFVGDYTDRGFESKQVIDHLMQLDANPPGPLTLLKGNHDELLLQFAENSVEQRRWLEQLGGSETLFSFGVHPPFSGASDEELMDAGAAFKKAVGQERMAFLDNLPTSTMSGNIFVCHAGAEPDKPLDQQSDHTLMWIRSMNRPRRDGNWIVHGHTIQKAANITDGRIAIDTGAFATGVLTAARITSGDITFIQTKTAI